MVGELHKRPNVPITRLGLFESDSIRATVDAALARFGVVDVLLNQRRVRVARRPRGPLDGRDPPAVDVNVFGLIKTIKAALPGMRTRRTGWPASDQVGDSRAAVSCCMATPPIRLMV